MEDVLKRLIFTILTLVLVGCSGNTTTTTTTNTPAPAETTAKKASQPLPDGWYHTSSNDRSFTIALPGDWVVTDSNDPEMQKLVEELIDKNSAYPQNVTTDYHFMAFDSEVKNDFVDNLNVIKQDVAQTLPFNEATGEALKAELVKNIPGAKDFDIEIVDIPHGKAYRYTANTDFEGPGGSRIKMFLTGYITFDNTTMYVLTFSTTPEFKDEFTTEVNQMVESVNIGG